MISIIDTANLPERQDELPLVRTRKVPDKWHQGTGVSKPLIRHTNTSSQTSSTARRELISSRTARSPSEMLIRSAARYPSGCRPDPR